MSKKKDKFRADFRKNRAPRARRTDWTRAYESARSEDAPADERISGKGELSRRRTVVGEQVADEDAGVGVLRAVDEAACLAGRVVAVRGLKNLVETADGKQYLCATRRLLKTLATDLRNVVVAGDRVLFRPEPSRVAPAPAQGQGRSEARLIGEGIIERVEPRRGVISRTSRGRQHVLVANIDLLLIVSSAAEPDLKPHLIDRFLVTAEKTRIRPVICINKIDLVDPATLQPLVGVYSQMGYRVLLASAKTGFGIDRLRRTMQGQTSAVCGQSGVGKSSLLNAVEPQLGLRVAEVSQETQKGKHTTTTAELYRLSAGGYVVDTPGIRQFQLWDVIPAEVAGFFRDIRPYVDRCRFPDCTHTHETDCGVKNAVADDLLDVRRYESYCHLLEDDSD
jgi:ribosome biogenesis GTPase